MSESFFIADLDRREFLDPSPLGGYNFGDALGEPISGMLVWLVARTGDPRALPFRGRWAGDRILVAGEEGAARDVWEACRFLTYRDLTVPVFEEYAGADPFRKEHFWRAGFLTDAGRFVAEWEEMRRLARMRKRKGAPF